MARHAESPPAHGGADAERALSAYGAAQAEELARAVAAMAVTPARVLCSDAVRARRTAEAVARVLGVRAETEERLGLEAMVSDTLGLIEGLAGAGEACLLVGHNPTQSIAAGRLCGRDIRLDTCDLVWLERSGDTWRLAGRLAFGPQARRLAV